MYSRKYACSVRTIAQVGDEMVLPAELWRPAVIDSMLLSTLNLSNLGAVIGLVLCILLYAV